MSIRPTPFHARTAEGNVRNAWIERCGFTIARDFGDVAQEALSARFSVVLSDISWRWRVEIEGIRAGEALARFLTRDMRALGTDAALKALWLSDGGAVRGAGVIARLAEERFLLASTAPDLAWLALVARQFDLESRPVRETGGIALIGPYARATLAAAGLTINDLEVLGFRRCAWNGLNVLVSRWGEHGGYEIWCDGDDALIVWDRLIRAGRDTGVRPAGALAMDILDLEAGVARPLRDYMPARTMDAHEPAPSELRLERLIDMEHRDFNGRTAFINNRTPSRVLTGLAFEGAHPAPHAQVLAYGNRVGRTLGSQYSPALRRAIALAQLEPTAARPGSVVTVVAPTTIERAERTEVTARVETLPFLPIPGPLPE